MLKIQALGFEFHGDGKHSYPNRQAPDQKMLHPGIEKMYTGLQKI